MTVRLIFLGALASTLIGFVLIGSALAWTNTSSITNLDASVGGVHFTVELERSASGQANLFGVDQVVTGVPGDENFAGYLTVHNDGDYSLRLLAGAVEGGSRVVITSVTPAAKGQCDASSFTGVVHDLLVGDFRPGTQAIVAYVSLRVSSTAPSGCVGAVVNYDIVVAMTT